MKRVAIALVAFAGPACAEDQIQYPTAEPGVWELEHTETGSRHTASIGYGVTPWWHTEAELESKAGQYGSIDSENVLVLTGCYDPDFDGDCHPTLFAAGVYAEYEHHWSKYAPDSLILGPIATINLDPVALTLNTLVEKSFGVGHENDWGLQVFAEARFRWKPWLSPAIEWASEIEDIQAPGQMKDQAHAIGPAVTGAIGGIKYKAGWLFSLTDENAGRPLLRIEYEF